LQQINTAYQRNQDDSAVMRRQYYDYIYLKGSLKKIAATNDVGDDGIVDGSSAITKTTRIRACLSGRQIRIPFFGLMLSCHAREFCGSVTANIGWYVISILHDQSSCNIDITWPVESTLWVKFVLMSIQICVFFIFVSILHDWHFM